MHSLRASTFWERRSPTSGGKAQIDLARKVGADALAHGATGKGNDQVRFELSYAAHAPDLRNFRLGWTFSATPFQVTR